MPPQSEGTSIGGNPLPEKLSSNSESEADTSLSSAALEIPKKPEKKPTRQWAAWTRQEEESFFSALRQVGKNFEKITCRVQSKNREQVRHYYYRLVRRMNKLLGPGFCLDAKNSKDTNAAMLRWWSLLEKYSCTASKLHRKPRRFKTFVETLAQQLLKDRNRNRRKRPYHGENGSIPLTPDSIYGKPPVQDVHMVKLVFVDSQSSQKLGNGKFPSSKRSATGSKGDGAVLKNTGQRRRAGCGAAYKKWEKAAIAGVSLVADAAEHLERTSLERSNSAEMSPPKSCNKNSAISGDFNSIPESSNTEGRQLNQIVEESITLPPIKLKLQLFPIDEATRRALEKDERNPHLELTVSSRKRISSIIDHLNRKWGDSSIASGEIMLLPYNAQLDTLTRFPKWTLNDVFATAGEVHTSVGSPSVFRLRYGWFTTLEDQSLVARVMDSRDKDQSGEEDERESREEREKQEKKREGVARADQLVLSLEGTGDERERHHSGPAQQILSNEEMGDEKERVQSLPNQRVSSRQETEDEKERFQSLPNQQVSSLQATEDERERFQSLPSQRVSSLQTMDDERAGFQSLPNQQVSSLEMMEDEREKRQSGPNRQVSSIEEADERETHEKRKDDVAWADSLTNMSAGDLMMVDGNWSGVPVSCDSFDAAIAGFLRNQDRPSASIFDAEETCDGFSFKPADSHVDPTKTNDLVDFYWPDSLGPLDIDVQPARYQGQDLLLGDSCGSLGGLTRSVLNGFDSFHNVSIFAPEREAGVVDQGPPG